ncbi:hypothetical protein Ga0080574_TMP3577 [Salipiger abyssi]|uniref:Uncharacterized protein n=1 Tax=Salipiger abyssi TaxID=1250539 RepID=A0A1P8UWX9_9RHOB|nr:hypothetical protein Ga0080574_TMP3577 [Salipiger abyssi]
MPARMAMAPRGFCAGRRGGDPRLSALFTRIRAKIFRRRGVSG